MTGTLGILGRIGEKGHIGNWREKWKIKARAYLKPVYGFLTVVCWMIIIAIFLSKGAGNAGEIPHEKQKETVAVAGKRRSPGDGNAQRSGQDEQSGIGKKCGDTVELKRVPKCSRILGLFSELYKGILLLIPMWFSQRGFSGVGQADDLVDTAEYCAQLQCLCFRNQWYGNLWGDSQKFIEALYMADRTHWAGLPDVAVVWHQQYSTGNERGAVKRPQRVPVAAFDRGAPGRARGRAHPRGPFVSLRRQRWTSIVLTASMWSRVIIRHGCPSGDTGRIIKWR